MLLAGQTTSQFGAQVSGIAIPLLAVLTLDASPFELGLVTASSTLAFALIGLPAGAWLDRWRRRPVLVASDLARTVLLATIPLGAVLGFLTIGYLVAISLLTGFARVFFDVGYQSYLPTVLGKHRVLAGNSSMEAIRASGQVVGPGIGGALVSLLGAANVVLIQAVTFAISAASLLAIRTKEPPIPPNPQRPHLLAQIIEGLSFVRRNRILRATAIASAAGNFSFAVAAAVSFIFLSDTLNLSATLIGLIVAAGSVTVVIGAAVTPRLSRLFGSARIIWLSLAVSGPITMIGPFAQPGWSVALIVVSTAVGEFGQIIYAVTNVSLRQRLCPDRMLGRVNATMRFLIMGLFPLGAIVGGILGETIGLRGTLWVSGGIMALSPVPLFLALRHTRDVEDLASWDREEAAAGFRNDGDLVPDRASSGDVEAVPAKTPSFRNEASVSPMRENAGMAEASKHISIVIERSVPEVYDFAADPARLPQWASGLSGSIEQVADAWVAQSPMGPVTIQFAPRNSFGVLDHDVTLPDGAVFYNPMRVLAHGDGAEVVFTLRRMPGASEADFERDAATIAADLATLKRILEA